MSVISVSSDDGTIDYPVNMPAADGLASGSLDPDPTGGLAPEPTGSLAPEPYGGLAPELTGDYSASSTGAAPDAPTLLLPHPNEANLRPLLPTSSGAAHRRRRMPGTTGGSAPAGSTSAAGGSAPFSSPAPLVGDPELLRSHEVCRFFGDLHSLCTQVIDEFDLTQMIRCSYG